MTYKTETDRRTAGLLTPRTRTAIIALLAVLGVTAALVWVKTGSLLAGGYAVLGLGYPLYWMQGAPTTVPQSFTE